MTTDEPMPEKQRKRRGKEPIVFGVHCQDDARVTEALLYILKRGAKRRLEKAIAAAAATTENE